MSSLVAFVTFEEIFSIETLSENTSNMKKKNERFINRSALLIVFFFFALVSCYFHTLSNSIRFYYALLKIHLYDLFNHFPIGFLADDISRPVSEK